MVVMGHISKPHGILGWIKICPYTEQIDGLMAYSVWLLGDGDGSNTWEEVEVDSIRIQNESVLLAKFKGYTDRTAVMPLSGAKIAIPRDDLPDLSKDGGYDYYWSDLIGSQVVNLRGEELGKVVGLLETGANDVLQVNGEHMHELLIPFIGPVIKKVDLETGQIMADWEIDY